MENYFGLSIILMKSLLLFNIVKYAGVAYLIFLGIKMIISRERILEKNGDEGKKSLNRIYT